MENDSIPLPSQWLSHRPRILLVGCGGNGSHMLAGLARLHLAMVALGGRGIMVNVVDPDLVSESNVARQLYSPADVGMSKAEISVQRINLFYGMAWQAHCASVSEQYMPDEDYHGPTLVIGCVDSTKARAAIERCVKSQRHCFWLDLGNSKDTGQVLLGEWRKPRASIYQTPFHPPLPTELFPQLLHGSDEGPSCSVAEALEKQSLFINPTLANYALNLLWRWFRNGTLEQHGYFVNLESGTATSLLADKSSWDRLRRQAANFHAPAKPSAAEVKALAAARTQWASYAERAARGSRL